MISKNLYRYHLFTPNFPPQEYLNLIKKKNNAWISFEKILRYHKRNYFKASKQVILGRVGESLNKTIFYRNSNRSICIFKKMKSKIFESGIDFIFIKFNRKNNQFEYYFFEVKATINNLSSCLIKIENWYKLENFTKKYLYELESIKDTVSNSRKLSKNQINLIKNDLNDLALNIILKNQLSHKYYFCSSIYIEKIVSKNPIIKKDPLLKNGFDYIFIIDDFYNNIIEVYKCLNIKI